MNRFIKQFINIWNEGSFV